ncbi:hypothetical protein [Mycolicibacterium sediminis]|uniref:hypothetical protein n=1 Tax=Mycolicibacterium sediminis TaxID=1286180 RepID=UPI0013D3AC93|nr:hypothetical protein [Mycolicibacterium sediminis]
MIATWAVAYLGVWLITAIAAFVAARHLGDHQLPWAQTLVLSFLAGAVWPLLVIGALELTSVAALSKAMSRHATRDHADEAHASTDVLTLG